MNKREFINEETQKEYRPVQEVYFNNKLIVWEVWDIGEDGNRYFDTKLYLPVRATHAQIIDWT